MNRRELLTRLRGAGWRYSDVVALIATAYGASATTARKNLRDARRFGYLEKSDGLYRVTPLAGEQLDRYGQLEGVEGMRFARFCSGRPNVSG